MNRQLVTVLGTVEDADSAQEVSGSLSRMADQYVEVTDDFIALEDAYISKWEDERLQREYGDRLKNSMRRARNEVRRVLAIPEAAEVIDAPMTRIENAFKKVGEAAGEDS